jgi:protein-S-isoprenylcysteine O-methyltransferase Ste14
MDSLLKDVISGCWIAFFAVWLLAAMFTKRTIYGESAADRLRYTVPIVLGWYLLFRGHHLPRPFSLQIMPPTRAILFLAAVLCLCGLTFCLWARLVLGRNWSGTVTVKENHELIVRGPYRVVRHPIYTGLLTMLIATALREGRVAGFIGLVVVWVSFWIKLRYEEELMRKEFPDGYASYERRVKRIVPFLL